MMVTLGTLSATTHLQALVRLRTTSLVSLATGRRDRAPADLVASERLAGDLAALQGELQTVERSGAAAAVADGAMAEISVMLARGEALAVANANTGGLTDAERRANQDELDAIVRAVDRTAASTTFAGRPLLDGSARLAAGGATLMLPAVSSARLGEYALSDVVTGGALDTLDGDAAAAADVLDAAAADVAVHRGRIGAFTCNIVDSTRNSLADAFAETAGAFSAIHDTDMALTAVELARLDFLNGATLTALQLLMSTSSAILALFEPSA